VSFGENTLRKELTADDFKHVSANRYPSLAYLEKYEKWEKENADYLQKKKEKCAIQ
jgi:hypothetical protein